MIISFKIKNFRSYKDESTFTFKALDDSFLGENLFEIVLDDGEKIRLLKTIGIFGANASGKSNVIWALELLSTLVRKSREFDVRTPVPFLPFMFDDESKTQPTLFDIEFISKGKRYRYVVEFTSFFEKEELYLYHEGKEELVYSLNGTNGKKLTAGIGWGRLSHKVDISFNPLGNQLLLSWMGVTPDNGMQHIYETLAYIEAEPIADAINLKNTNENVAANILKNEESQIFHRLNHLITVADTGISKINMKEHSKDELKIPGAPQELVDSIYEQTRWEFTAEHTYHSRDGQEKHANIPMRYESTGTKNLFGVGARVLNILKTGGILAYDEMNVALHSELFKLLVDLFNNPKSNPLHAQLIFTTHDATIARDGEMRADQVWFAEKDHQGHSELYSAQDFEDASINMPFERWYRNGRFGALPKFGDINSIFED